MASVSAAQDDDDDAPVDGINITPLVDVLMVVLVMFILTATAQIAGIKVNLPKASSSMALSQPKTKAISVNDAGQVFLDAYPVTCPSWRTGCAPRKRSIPTSRSSCAATPPCSTRRSWKCWICCAAWNSPGRPGHRQAAIGAEANVMSFPESDSPRARRPALRWLKLAAVAVALAAAAYLLWRWANDMSGVRREPPKVSAIIPLPPPPPPPPEPENRRSPSSPRKSSSPCPSLSPCPRPSRPSRRTRRRLGRPTTSPTRCRSMATRRPATTLQHRRRPGQGHVGRRRRPRRQRHVQPVPRLRAAEDPARGRAHPQP